MNNEWIYCKDNLPLHFQVVSVSYSELPHLVKGHGFD